MKREMEVARSPEGSLRGGPGRAENGKEAHTKTRADWLAEGAALFGDDQMAWRFVCPSCEHVASVQDWKDAKAPEGTVAYSCVGRYTGATKTIFQKPGPCNYAGGGLFGLNPVRVIDDEGKEHNVFAFAKASAQ